jgi:hypothetical protein
VPTNLSVGLSTIPSILHFFPHLTNLRLIVSVEAAIFEQVLREATAVAIEWPERLLNVSLEFDPSSTALRDTIHWLTTIFPTNLRALSLRISHEVGSPQPELDIDGDIFRRFIGLEEIELVLPGARKLDTFQLLRNHGTTLHRFSLVAANTRPIATLEKLENISAPHLPSIPFECQPELLLALATAMPGLETLPHFLRLSSQYYPAFPRFHQLKSLRFNRGPPEDNTALLTDALSQCRQLTRVEFYKWDPQLSDEQWETIFSGAMKLSSLFFDFGVTESISFLQSPVVQRQLRTLELDSTELPLSHFKYLRLPHLTSLSLFMYVFSGQRMDVRSTNWADTQEWIRNNVPSDSD